MKKNLHITKLRCSEHILPVRWPFVKSRFHCILRKKGGVRVWEKRGGKKYGRREKKSREEEWMGSERNPGENTQQCSIVRNRKQHN